jgi:hypothetical protein
MGNGADAHVALQSTNDLVLDVFRMLSTSCFAFMAHAFVLL